MTDRVIVGRFGSPFGVRGWIKIYSYTDPIENILKYPHWQIEINSTWQPVLIESIKKQAKGIIAKIKDYESPEEVRTFTNHSIAIYRHELPALPHDEYYWSDLTGLKVLTTTGTELGLVDSLLETGANDVFVVKGDRTRLIPYTTQVVIKIDLNEKTIVVDWDPDF